MITPRIGCYAVYESTEEGWENAAEQFKVLCEGLRKSSLEVVEAPEFVVDEASAKRAAQWFAGKDIDILHPLVITWSFDHLTYILWQQVKVPVAIRTIPGIRTGSVVGGQQLGAVLTELGIEHKLFYGRTDSSETLEEIAVYAKACALKKCLSNIKIAMLGRRTPGMTPIAFDETEILEKFGLRITTFGMDEFSLYADSLSEDEIKSGWEEVAKRAAVVTSSEESGYRAIRMYLAMKKLILEQGFAAIAVGSYPQCQGVACLPISLLNDEGIAAGCEGDMNSTIAMYILSRLSNEPVHFGEMLEMNEKENTIITSHCGAAAVSLSAEDGYTLCPVRLANDGVCVRFRSKPGPVTYVNMLGRKGMYRMCAFEGNAIPTEMVFEGNPMKIRLDMSVADVLKVVSDYGFSHHWMAVYGHVVKVLKEFCRMTGVKGVFPG